MKLRCLCLIFLLVNITTISAYPDNQINSMENVEDNLSRSSLSSFMKRDRSIVKRSQRNANILYRYCRQSGGHRQFCLKYAIQMLYATGH